MGKHKKLLKSEKAKVKLKGNKLSKGQNVTKTDFKVNKIIIKDQISGSYNDEVRKYNLKEIFIKLKHHNPSFRMDGLKILKEKISTGFDLDLDLGVIVQKLSAMCLDVERDVRRESFKIMTIVFSTLSRVHLEPFFGIILSYLSCAMTHIQQSIQDDSLLMLDIILKFQPKLMAVHSDKIFDNCLDMISKVTIAQNRSLTVSIGNKMSTIKWRCKILERMNELLKTIIMVISGSGSTEKEKVICGQFVLGEPLYFPLLRRNFSLVQSATELFNKPLAEKDTRFLDDDKKLKNYINNLVPVLFQAWLELSPSHNKEILTTDAAATLKQVVEIFKSLWEFVERKCNKTNDRDLLSWFRKKYFEDFRTNIFSKFPYEQMEEIKGHKKISHNQSNDKRMTVAGGQFCIFQNSTIIYLYCAIGANEIQSDGVGINKTITFLNDILTRLNQLTVEELNCVERTLQMILLKNSIYFMKADCNKTRILLRTVVNILNVNDFSLRDFKNKMIAMIANIILDDQLYKLYGACEFEDCVSALSKLLCKPQVSQSNITVLSTLAKQKNEAFLNALKMNMNYIISNLPKIHVSGYKDQDEAKKLIVNLFFWIKNWTEEDKRNACEYARTHMDNELAKYFQFIIMQ